MTPRNAFFLPLVLAACFPAEGTDFGGAGDGEVLFGELCPAVDSASAPVVRRFSGSAAAFDTCLKGQPSLASWTFSSTLGQSPSPAFRVLKTVSPTRASAGACTTTTGTRGESTITLFGTGSDRSRIDSLVNQCIAAVGG